MNRKGKWLALGAILITGLASCGSSTWETITLGRNSFTTITLGNNGFASTVTDRGEMNFGGGALVQGNGDIVTKIRHEQNFTSVRLRSWGDVRIHHSHEHKVVVTTDSNIQGYFDVEVHEGELRVGFLGNGRFLPTEVAIDVYMPVLDGIAIPYSGDFVIGDLDMATLDIRVTGSGRIEFTGGSVGSLGIVINGSAYINAKNLQAESAIVTVNGFSKMELWVTENLCVRNNGVGVIAFRGEPATMDIRNNGSGRVGFIQ